MKRNLLAGLALSLLVSAPVFAQGGGGIGRAGNSNGPYAHHDCKDTRRSQSRTGRSLSRRLATFAESHDVSEQRPDRSNASSTYRFAGRDCG